MIDIQIKQNNKKIVNAIGLLIKSRKFPCDLIKVVIIFFSRIGPMTIPSTHGAMGMPFSSIKKPTMPKISIRETP